MTCNLVPELLEQCNFSWVKSSFKEHFAPLFAPAILICSIYEPIWKTQSILNTQFGMLITQSNENQFSPENSKAFLLGESNFQAVFQVSAPIGFGCKSV